VVIESDDEEFDDQGQAFSSKALMGMSEEPVQATLSASQAVHSTANVVSTGLHEAEVFRTKITPFRPTKFVFVEDAATVSNFLEAVRIKWALPPLLRATEIHVLMDGQEFCVDIDEERDWAVVRRLLHYTSLTRLAGTTV
jgi:CMP-N-acetylneuraminic acid synthetase